MKYFGFLLLFIIHSTFGQNPILEKADEFHFQGNYKEEIKLRKAILDTISDKTSDLFKQQHFKKLIAEYADSDDLDVRYEKIKEADEIIQTIKDFDPFRKIEIGLEHVENMGMVGVDGSVEKTLELQDFATSLPKSQERDESLSKIYNALGRIYLSFQNLDEAIFYFEKCIEFNTEVYGYNSVETAKAYDLLSRTHTYSNNYPAVLDNADKALEIYETVQPENPFTIFQQYAHNLQVHKYYGDLKKVEELLEKIETYYNANKNNPKFIHASHPDFKNLNPVYATYYYVLIQNANLNEDPIAAEKALEAFKKTLPKKYVVYTGFEANQILSFYFETGSIFHKYQNKKNIENYYKAKKYYTDVTDFSQSLDFGFGEIQSYMMLGILGSDYHQWEDVITASTKALNHPVIESFNQVQTIKHNLGLAYAKTGDYKKALEVFEEEYQFYLNDSGIDYYALTNLAESGNIYLDIYKENKEEIYLEKAYNHFFLASQIFSQLYRGGEFSSRLHTFSNTINDGLLTTAILLGKNQKEVVSQIEINNSDYLWSSFLNNRKEPINESMMLLQSQMDSLQNRQEVLAHQISSVKGEKDQVELLRSELKSTEKLFETTGEELKKRDHSFYQFSRTDFDLDKIQKKIQPDEQVVKYILTKLSSYAYVIDSEGVRLINLEKNAADFKEDVLSFVSILKNRTPGFESHAKSLYNELIQPLDLKEKSHLVVIPDQILAYLPFEILMNESDEFLLHHHAVSYGYSLKLMDLQKSLEGNYQNRLAAFSPEYDLQLAENSSDTNVQVLVRSGNYKLAGAEDEAREISSIFSGDLFSGKEASKSNFLNRAAEYDILHLAMHAIINEEDPNKSGLIFGNEEHLFLDELYQLKIPVHLAVLSACNTGFGEIQEGEGVQSLSRAFTYAGVKSTVMSLWPVPDQQTSEIMTEFYKQLKSGASKTDALRLAKLNYLENVNEPELAHPFYWAGFLISGDVEPLQTKQNSRWYVIGGIFMFFVVLTALSRRRKNSRTNTK